MFNIPILVHEQTKKHFTKTKKNKSCNKTLHIFFDHHTLDVLAPVTTSTASDS